MRNNNFDILRLMCALLVIVSHSYALLVIYGEEPLLQGTGWLLASGIGLCGFFTISGYLILQSLVTSKNIFSYLAKRCLRIFPGLLVCLILVVVACSFFYTGEGNYWTQYETYSFIWNNLSLYDLQWEIPGVFVNNPYDASIDGPLWTLAYEYSLYLCIIVLFFMRKHKGVIAGLSILALALILTKNIFFATKLANAYYFNLSLNLFMPFAQYFVTGMLLQNRQTFHTDKARLIIIGICAASAICITIIHTYIHTYIRKYKASCNAFCLCAIHYARRIVLETGKRWIETNRRYVLRDVYLCVPDSTDANSLNTGYYTNMVDGFDFHIGAANSICIVAYCREKSIIIKEILVI